MERLSRAHFAPRTASAAAIVLLASAVGGAFVPGPVQAASQSTSQEAGALEAARDEAPAIDDRTGIAHGGPLARPASWQALLRESAENGQPVVVLFSTPGCAFCELVRSDHLRHLARAQGPRGMRVVELGLTDRAPLGTGELAGTGSSGGAAGSTGIGAPGGTGEATGAVPAGGAGESTAANASSPLTPAALAASLGIRFAPTVAFFGPRGELAERLVGYQSADFYGAYLDERIATARAALAEDKRR